MSVYDAFMYSGELECLLIHLHELADVVDRFILCEGDRTFTGQLKDRLYYHGHDEQRIPPALRDRIIPVYAVLPERAASPWDRETYQRNSILLGLGEARKDDVVLVGDVDEIPRASAVREVVEALGDKEQVAFDQTHAMYYVNNVCYTLRWRGTQAARVSWARHVTPQGMRDDRNRAPFVADGGWHFTSLQGAEGLDGYKRKLCGFSHADEVAPFMADDHLRECVALGIDPTGRRDVLFQVREPVEGDYPTWLWAHRQEMAQVFYPGSRL